MKGCRSISKCQVENFIRSSVSLSYSQYIVISGFLFDIGFVMKVQECNVEIESLRQISADAIHPALGITADFVVREFDECKMSTAYIYFLFYFVIGFVSSKEVSETKTM